MKSAATCISARRSWLAADIFCCAVWFFISNSANSICCLLPKFWDNKAASFWELSSAVLCWFCKFITFCSCCCWKDKVSLSCVNWLWRTFKFCENWAVCDSAVCLLAKLFDLLLASVCALCILACCSLDKFCAALVWRACALLCAIGKALCITELKRASLPTVETSKPLCVIFWLTASTAGLAHAGIFPVSMPANSVSICEDTRASGGSAAIAAITSGGSLSIWAVTFAGSWTIDWAKLELMFATSAVNLIAASWAAIPVTVLRWKLS